MLAILWIGERPQTNKLMFRFETQRSLQPSNIVSGTILLRITTNGQRATQFPM